MGASVHGELDPSTIATAAIDRSRAGAGPTRARAGAVGRYLILDPIGAGGMGSVYSAYDTQLDRRVALKFLRGLRGEEMHDWQARLMREAQAMARLSHPNVVTVYDVGFAEDGQVFLSMEIVDGGTLSDWLKAQRRTWRAIVHVFCEAGEGLASAHGAGIVHRDFKPENVLIGSDGRPRVTDFGVARVALSEPSQGRLKTEAHRTNPSLSQLAAMPVSQSSLSNPLTMAGAMLGTPGYMAPEQYDCIDEIDARADIFAFCASLYRALYGERAFEGSSVEEIAKATRAGRVRPARKGSNVPFWLRRVLLHGLAVDPSERPASMPVLLAALRADPAKSRRRWFVAGTLALAGCAVASVVHASGQRKIGECRAMADQLEGAWDGPRKGAIERAFGATHLAYAADTWVKVERALDAYSRHWEESIEQACLAARVKGERSEAMLQLQSACLDDRRDELRALSDVLSSADAKTVETAVHATQALSTIEPCTDLDRLSVSAHLPSDPTARAEIRALRGAIATAKALNDAGKSRQSLERLQALQDRVDRSGYGPLLVSWKMRVAGAQEEIDNKAAAVDFERAAVLADRYRLDDQKAEALIRLVDDETRLGLYDQGHRWIAFADAAIARLGGNVPLEAARDVAEGWVFIQEGNSVRAAPLFERAIALSQRAHIAGHGLSQAYSGLSTALVGEGRMDEGFANYRKTIELAESELGPVHPAVAVFYNNLASDEIDAGRIDDAIAASSHAVGMVKAAVERGEVAATSKRLAVYEATLGQALLRGGRLPEAIEHLVRARDAFGAAHDDFVLFTDNELAEAERLAGEELRARRALDAAGAVESAMKKDADPALVAGTMNVLAKLALDAGNVSTARPLAGRALAILEHEHPTAYVLADTRFTLARAVAIGTRTLPRDARRARSLAEQAQDGFSKLHDQARLDEVSAWLAGLR